MPQSVRGLLPDPLLEVRGIVKRFPGVLALGGVDLDVRAGEVHCLLGQNGAGKSTLIKVLSASYQPDEGEVLWEDQPVTLGTPQAAMRLGISTIYRSSTWCPSSPSRRTSSSATSSAAAASAGSRDQPPRPRAAGPPGHPEISATRAVGRLPPAAQQVVSMARALSQDTRLLILDEPSAVLDQGEVDTSSAPSAT